MFCPNCGRENSETQNFCTGCGLKLPVTAANEKPEQLVPVYFHPEARIWQNPVVYALFTIAVGIFMMMFGRRVLGDKTMMDLGTVVTLIGAALLGLKGVFLVLQQAGVMQLPKSSVQQKQMPPRQQPTLQPAEQGSVVEHTTRNLDAVPLYEKPRNTQPTLK